MQKQLGRRKRWLGRSTANIFFNGPMAEWIVSMLTLSALNRLSSHRNGFKPSLACEDEGGAVFFSWGSPIFATANV